jgi:hypothetical protein
MEHSGKIRRIRLATISLMVLARGMFAGRLDFKLPGVRTFVAGVTINSSSDPLTNTSHVY